MTQIRFKKVPIAVIKALQDLADCRGYSIEEALRDAVNTEVYLNEQLEQGSEILCKDPCGKVRRVVFTHMET